MTTPEYVVQEVIGGRPAAQVIESVCRRFDEALSQLKSDRAKALSKRFQLPVEDVLRIAEVDPTANGSYMEWMARMRKNNQFPEDTAQLLSAIGEYERLKRTPAFTGNRNIMAYKTLAELQDVVVGSHGVSSSGEMERQIKAAMKVINDKYPQQQAKKDGAAGFVKGGYQDWITQQVKSKQLVLPEDAEKLLGAIDEFEAARKDPNFRGFKSISQYESFGDLAKALASLKSKGSNAAAAIIPDGPGIKHLSSSTVNGHRYDLYAVTTSEAAAKYFRHPDHPGSGWCVKDPKYFNSYGMGPQNPAYEFFKDGLPYALSDLKSRSVKDEFDADAKPPLIFELLYLEMPDELKTNILNINPWTKKFKDIILTEGPAAAVTQAFKNASAPGDLRTVANDAIDYWKYFQTEEGKWLHPPKEALAEISKNPFIAAALAAKVLQKRVPDYEPLILTSDRAMAFYYDQLAALGQFPNNRWPEYEPKALEYAKQGKITPLVCYASRTGYDIPGGSEVLKNYSNLAYQAYTKKLKDGGK